MRKPQPYKRNDDKDRRVEKQPWRERREGGGSFSPYFNLEKIKFTDGGYEISIDRIAYEMLEEAIKEGRHSDKVSAVCSSCRQVVDGLYFAEKSGGMGSQSAQLCKKCWKEKYGGKEVIDPDTGEIINHQKPFFIQPSKPKIYKPTFDEKLLLWAKDHMPAAFEAFSYGSDRKWEVEVLASIYRERARLDPAWHLWVVVSDNAKAIYRMAGAIVRAGGYPINLRQTYADWMYDIRAAEGVERRVVDES